MRRTLTALSSAAVLLLACKGEAEADPKSLYRVEASASPVAAGQQGTFRIAVRPTAAGAHVKPETPFRGKLVATGPLALQKTEIAFGDNARIEGGGPVFEIPFDAKAPGEGTLAADLTFFVCTAQSCMRTTEQVTVPVQVK